MPPRKTWRRWASILVSREKTELLTFVITKIIGDMTYVTINMRLRYIPRLCTILCRKWGKTCNNRLRNVQKLHAIMHKNRAKNKRCKCT